MCASLKQNMKIFRVVSRNSVHASFYCKIIIKTLVGHPLCNSFNFKIVNEITVKLHCQLFFNSEPHDDNTQSY